MNLVLLTGRFTSEPELKTTNSGVECMSFSLAVDRGYKDKDGERITDFVPCKAWKQTAVFIDKYFSKGDGITVQGRFESRKYQDKDGNNRTAYEINVTNAEFPLSRKDTSSSQNALQGNVVDDDLPF